MHDTVDEPFVAETVMVSPAEPPEADTAGVESFVTLSVLDEPESDAASRSAAPGADGAAVSTVNDSAPPADDWFPAASVNLAVTDHTPSDNTGRSHEAAPNT